MSKKRASFEFSSKFTEMMECNETAARGVLQICYSGRNRHKDFISKEVLERCLPTMYNKPIVCCYDRVEDEIGEHDMGVKRDEDGSVHLINLTNPVGTVPESALHWWEEIEEEDGDVHEYLCVEVILWKRQEAFRKIQENVVTRQSMEIVIKEFRKVNGLRYIDDLEFEAFCLLGVDEPCYEGASLQVFSLQDKEGSFQEEMKAMLADFSTVGDSVRHSRYSNSGGKGNQKDLEGGKKLNKKLKILAKFGLKAADLDVDLSEISEEELEEKCQEISDQSQEGEAQDDSSQGEGEASPEAEGVEGAENSEDSENSEEGEGVAPRASSGEGNEGESTEGAEGETTETGGETGKFSLMGQFMDSLCEGLCEEKYNSEWFGEVSRYSYVDCDRDISIVYCYDREDWHLYGFSYSEDGDSVKVDFSTKKRMKFSIVDYDHGSTQGGAKEIYAMFSKKYAELQKELTEKYSLSQEKATSMEQELGELRKFKLGAQQAELVEKREAVFALFQDLADDPAFQGLCAEGENYSLEDLEGLEDKCYALRGRKESAKFSLKNDPYPSIKLKVEPTGVGSPAPYGGLMKQFD